MKRYPRPCRELNHDSSDVQSLHRMSYPTSFPLTKYRELKLTTFVADGIWTGLEILFRNPAITTALSSSRPVQHVTGSYLSHLSSVKTVAQKYLQNILSLFSSIFVCFRNCSSFSPSPSIHIILFDLNTLNTCNTLSTKTFEYYPFSKQFQHCRYIQYPPHKVPCDELTKVALCSEQTLVAPTGGISTP